MQTFVVLSGSRSCTSLLSSTLNSHPGLLCHGEVFHKRPSTHLRGALERLSQEDIDEMRTNVSGFLDKVFDQPDVAAVGY